MAPVSPAAVRHERHIGDPHPAMAASAFCSGIPVPLPVSLLEKTSGESLHGKPKKALSVLLFHPRRILYISTSSYSLPPMPSFSAASTVWMPFLDSMRSSRWSLPGSSEAYTRSRQA